MHLFLNSCAKTQPIAPIKNEEVEKIVETEIKEPIKYYKPSKKFIIDEWVAEQDTTYEGPLKPKAVEERFPTAKRINATTILSPYMHENSGPILTYKLPGKKILCPYTDKVIIIPPYEQ